MGQKALHRWTVAIVIVLLMVVALIFIAGAIGWNDGQRRTDEAWLDAVTDLTPQERGDLSATFAHAQERQVVIAQLKRWDDCVKRYRRDGAADARSDVERRRAAPYWGHSGGYMEMEWVPGLEETCAPPLPTPGVNLPPEVTSRRGNFRELDQMGAEFEDAQWRIGLTGRCDRASRTYAATYNRMLARLDPAAFRQCRPVTDENRVTYRY